MSSESKERATQLLTKAISDIQTNFNHSNENGILNQIVKLSPLILTFCILVVSLCYQTYKGFIFFIFLIFFSFIRVLITKNKNFDKTFNMEYCNAFSTTSNMFQSSPADGFLVFFITFLTSYILAPMIYYQINNIYIIIFLSIYSLIVIFYSSYMCSLNFFIIFLNIFYAISSVIIIILILSMVPNSKLLSTIFLVEEIKTDATFCSMPSKQTFKCNVYKNGELVSSTTKS